MNNIVHADRLAHPPTPRDSHESVAAFLELLDLGDLFLRAGMRHQLGADGDVDAAYREWNLQHMEVATETTIHMLEELNRRESAMFGETVASTLRQVWAAIGDLGLPAAVMGGIALSAWRHPRNTRDVDLLVGILSTDPDAVLRGMQAHGFRPWRIPALIVVGPARFFQLLYTPPGTFVDIKTDLLLADSAYQQTALSRRRPFDWPELNLKVEALTCEDLILHKLLAGRVIDRADVVALQMANRTNLDFRYLGEWLRQLSLTSQWAECWAEAFPIDADPIASS